MTKELNKTCNANGTDSSY